MDKILEGIRRFREEVFPERKRRFEALRAGQQPELLLITCSDSRIDPYLFTQTDPGDVFVLRNAGNLVPPAGAGSGAEAATVEFAIGVLRVRHIAICGHSHCGAMAALQDPAAATGLPALRAWLEFARPALAGMAALQRIEDPALRLVAANVAVQLDHLRTHPAVAAAVAQGAVRLHGWVYRFEVGEVLEVDAGAEGGLRALGQDPDPTRASA